MNFHLPHIICLIALSGIHADVWKKIANRVSVGLIDPVTPTSIRIRVARNGGDIQSKLGIISLKKPTNFTTIDNRKFNF